MNWKEKLSKRLQGLSETLLNELTNTSAEGPPTAPPPPTEGPPTAPPPPTEGPPTAPPPPTEGPPTAPPPVAAVQPAAPRRASRYQPGDYICSEYRVERVLHGGMGEVYLCSAQPPLHGKLEVAIKMLPAHLLHSPRHRSLLEREVEVWVGLGHHPNIVRCHSLEIDDTDPTDLQPFILLDRVLNLHPYGISLHDWLRLGPIEVQQALNFAIGVCVGLVFINNQQPGLVHRDLKPQNILLQQGVQRSSVQGEPHERDFFYAQITDFGIATIVEVAAAETTNEQEASSQPRKGSTAGTREYMAPEQWRGDPVDPRTDIYALGCVLYEMLTGRRPYLGHTRDEYRHLHCEAPIPTLPDSLPLAAELAPVIARCMAKQPDERFASAEDLLQVLTHIYQQQFGEQPRPSLFYADDDAPPFDADAEDDIWRESLPVSSASYIDRARTYRRVGRPELALLDYERAIESFDKWRGGGSVPDKHVVFRERANKYYDQGRYEEALADYDQAIALDPTNAMAYNNRGYTYQALGDHTAALADYDQAIALGLTDIKVYRNRSSANYELGYYDAVLADLSQIITLAPTDATAYSNRATTYRMLGNYAAALADYDQAIALDPALMQAYARRGDIYLEQDDHAAALSNYDQAIALNPGDAKNYAARGIVHHVLEHYTAALADYSQAIALDPTNAESYAMRGDVYQTLGDYATALADYSQAIALDPTNAESYAMRGDVHQTLGDYAAALADYDQAIALAPHDPTNYERAGQVCLQMGNQQQARAYFNHATQAGGESAALDLEETAPLVSHGHSAAPEQAGEAGDLAAQHARDCIQKGINLLAEGRDEAAQSKFLDALWADPSAPEAFVKLGALYANQGYFYKALVAFEAAAERGNAQAAANVTWITQHLAQSDQPPPDDITTSPLPPQEAMLAFERGELDRAIQRTDDALAHYAHALALAPTFAEAWNRRGCLYRDMERYQEALDDLNQALQLDPANALYFVQRGTTYRDMGRDEAALADYRQALRLDPTSMPAYFARSNFYFRRRDYKRALKDDEQAIKLEPHNPTGYFNRAMCYKHLKKYRQALQDFTRVIELGQDDSSVYRNRGDVFIELNRYQDARADYELLLAKDPDNANALCNLGFIYKELEMGAEALKVFNRAIEAAPHYAWAWYQRGRLFAEVSQFEDALEDLQRAIEITPSLAQAHRFIGHVYREVGAYRRALVFYEEAARHGDAIGAEEAAHIRRLL